MDTINEILIALTTLILAGSVIVVLIIGHLNRKGGKDGETRGIGWQFIRYTVLSIALPIVAILALNNTLEGEAATIIAGALGYAFGKKDDS
ncbi:hypothetical protein WH95_01930 [Kiloniella litopenaei]|uniref:Uncharacterized protein n=1 Tax=Kiloniella litopenaei TaxID=1549748 RepID=A0A0M2RDQ0_9PROT|nr:hypothetical protein [Kiloniella litopenaei]KKJ78135.1 hypothetical protein WH95_01930 [Kiloniella litopenaei]